MSDSVFARPAVPRAWRPLGALDGVLPPGRSGRREGSAGIVARAREGLRLASVLAAPNGGEALAAALERRLGFAAPAAGACAFLNGTGLVWSGPGHWLLVSETALDLAALAADLGPVAAVSDQSDARAVLRLSGARVRDTLAKGCLVDLHPRMFGPGRAAMTSIAHVGTQIWQVEPDTFDIAVFRTLAGSFVDWLTASAAEYGLEVEPAIVAGRG